MMMSAFPRAARLLFVASAFVALIGSNRLQAGQQGRTLGAPAGGQITVDFLAVTSNGTPVTDLKAEDVTLRISGRPRAIKSLQLVKIDTTPAAAPAAAPAPAAPAEAMPMPFGTNVQPPRGSGRVFYLVIDNESLTVGSERPIVAGIEQLLGTLGAEDQVGIATVPHGGISLEPTKDLGRVRATLANLKGAASASGESVGDATARSRLSLMQFVGMMEALSGADRPSTFVFISGGLLGPQTAGTASQSANPAGGTGSSNSLNADLTAEDFATVRPAAAGARAQVYVILAEGGTSVAAGAAPPTSRNSATSSTNVDPKQGLMNMAGDSGGQFFQLALPNETALSRVGRETSSYYVATLDAEADDHTGTNHAVSLKTTRDGVTLRTRPDLFAKKVAAGAAAKPPTVNDMIKTADVYRDLPMRVTASVKRNNATDAKLYVSPLAEPADPSVRFNSLLFAMFDSTGKLVANYKADSSALSQGVGRGALLVPPGKYRLRAAATDAAGQTGTADYTIEVGLQSAGPYKASSIAFGTKGAQGIQSNRVQFSSEPEAAAYFELYGPAPTQDSGFALSMELAKSLTGPAMDIDLQLAASPTTEADRFVVAATVPLAKLDPGDYVIRVKFGVKDQMATMIGTLRKAPAAK